MSLFDWSKKGPLSLFDCDPYSVTKVRKNLTFETLKSCLGLRAVSLIPIFSRYSASAGASFRKQAIYISKRTEENPERALEVGFVNF